MSKSLYGLIRDRIEELKRFEYERYMALTPLETEPYNEDHYEYVHQQWDHQFDLMAMGHHLTKLGWNPLTGYRWAYDAKLDDILESWRNQWFGCWQGMIDFDENEESWLEDYTQEEIDKNYQALQDEAENYVDLGYHLSQVLGIEIHIDSADALKDWRENRQVWSDEWQSPEPFGMRLHRKFYEGTKRMESKEGTPS